MYRGPFYLVSLFNYFCSGNLVSQKLSRRNQEITLVFFVFTEEMKLFGSKIRICLNKYDSTFAKIWKLEKNPTWPQCSLSIFLKPSMILGFGLAILHLILAWYIQMWFCILTIHSSCKWSCWLFWSSAGTEAVKLILLLILIFYHRSKGKS